MVILMMINQAKLFNINSFFLTLLTMKTIHELGTILFDMYKNAPKDIQGASTQTPMSSRIRIKKTVNSARDHS